MRCFRVLLWSALLAVPMSSAWAQTHSSCNALLLLGNQTYAGFETNFTRGLLKRLASMDASDIETISVLVHPELTGVRYIERFERPLEEYIDPRIDYVAEGNFEYGYQEGESHVPQNTKLKRSISKTGVEVLSEQFVYSGYYLLKVRGSKQSLIHMLNLRTTVHAGLKTSRHRADAIASGTATMEEDWITRRRNDRSYSLYIDEMRLAEDAE